MVYWTPKNWRLAHTTFKSLQTRGAGQMTPKNRRLIQNTFNSLQTTAVNWTIKNWRPAQDTVKSLQTGGAGQWDLQELRPAQDTFKSLHIGRAGQGDSQELKGWLTTHLIALKLGELTNWTLKNWRPAQEFQPAHDTFKSLRTGGNDQLDSQ